MSKEEALQSVTDLVEKYQSLDDKTKRSFTEADTRRVFIIPLFHALGWDVYNREEVAEEVKAADGRVDYVFKINGVSQFYLEAKALRVDLTRPEHTKQAITYAYNKGITWACLSNFEGLHIYNAQTGRPFITLVCDKFLESFEDLWLLSKESFQTNALNDRAEKYGALPPRLGVEQRLYNQLRQWREELYNQIHQYNRHLKHNEIDEVIQRLFNRLIFIRNCEDRQIEERVLLSTLHEWRSSKRKGELVERIQGVFREFDGHYDSDLFAHHLTDEVFIESMTLEHIIDGLYEVPGGMANYDFSVIDADVLGAVYEQYLGHVAAIATRRAKEAQAKMDLGLPVEETYELTAKKQRRKEQGIYYTPKFVTDYIVQQTVGRFLQERSHDEILNMKILDPACGSGSFLIRAYEELLKYHAYQKGKPIVELDQWERLSILTGNIFGVDLDMQAVEIARLNLLLRTLAKREILPSLAGNIHQGNSLISGSEEELKKYFGETWREKKPFNWEHEFDSVMANGGFDVVIGNPPYVGFHGFKEDKDYFKDTYATCKGRFDIYLPFIERGLALLNEGGYFGFICPTNFTKRQHGQELRKLLKRDYTILDFIDFQDYQVFEGALNYTGVFIIQKLVPQNKHQLNYIERTINGDGLLIEQNTLNDNGWVFRDKKSEQLINKIKEQPNTSLAEFTSGISEGIVTGKNQVFLLPIAIADKLGIEKEIIKPIIQGRQIHRYYHQPAQYIIIYPYRDEDGRAGLIGEEELEDSFPVAWEYLNSRKQNLAGRQYFDNSSKAWYELWNERSFKHQASEKIVVPELASNNRFAYCNDLTFYLDTVCGVRLGNLESSEYPYLLGILNSSLLEFYYKKTTVPKASGFYIYKTMFLNQIPIRHINFEKHNEKAIHDDLIALVSRTVELNRRDAIILNEASNERDKLFREIERNDKEIDRLVYDLYGLSEDERKIVEGGLNAIS